MTEYENLMAEKPHIAAAVKRECSISTALNVLTALNIQDAEIQRLQRVIDSLDNVCLSLFRKSYSTS